MSTIFKDIQQIRDYITVDISSTINVVAPYIQQAEKYVRDIVGDELYDLLVEYVNNSLVVNNDYELLLPYCRLPLANFGYLLAVDKINVNVGQTGITVTVSNNVEPASQWRIEQFKKSLENAGYAALEELIKFLEKNVAIYTQWATSNAYSYQRKFFINNANDFQLFTEKNISRLEFLKIKEHIKLSEVQIQGIVCNELFAELKEQYLNKTVTADNQKLIDYIQPAICYSALAKIDDNLIYSNEAKRLMETIRIYLNANAISYPLYLASNCYSSTSEEIDYEDKGVYGFGL